MGDTSRVQQRLPTSFQPDNLGRISVDPAIQSRKESGYQKSEDVLHTEFYLTRIRSAKEDYATANIRPDLQQYVRYGRPNLKEIFATMRSYAHCVSEKSVAVMTCGPIGMIDETRILCSTQSIEGIRFDFHGEVFEF